MTYTKKMHNSIRRDTKDKQHNHITDLLDEIERLQEEISEMKKIESADFWCNWVYPDGATAEQVQNELEDYHMILDNVSIVYDHVTGGRISKPNTLAHEVTGEADNYYREHYEELYAEEEEDRRLDEKEIKITGIIDSGVGKSTISGWVIKE